MSRWISITIDDLNNAKIASLVDALRTAALASGQPERSADIIQRVVDRVRRKIASNHANRLDADETTIPRGLKDDTILLIIGKLKNALEEDQTQVEIDEIARIDRDLNRIADGKDTVEQPDDAIEPPVEAGSPSPSVTECRREKLNRSRGL